MMIVAFILFLFFVQYQLLKWIRMYLEQLMTACKYNIKTKVVRICFYFLLFCGRFVH